MKKRMFTLLGVGMALYGGCADTADPLYLAESAHETERKLYIPAFADKNDNGKYDRGDTVLYWSGASLSSTHSIVIPRFKNSLIYTNDTISISSAKNVTIQRDMYCGPKPSG